MEDDGDASVCFASILRSNVFTSSAVGARTFLKTNDELSVVDYPTEYRRSPVAIKRATTKKDTAVNY